MRGLHSNRTRGRKAWREGGGNQDNPRDEQPIRSVFENDEVLFRRRSHAPLSQTCTAGACACSCKSRRAPRPRKPDGKLSRHGLGARRVALLAPRGVLSDYQNFGKVQKSVPHFGRRQAYSEWGRSPVGEVGVCHSHVRGRQLIYFPDHAVPFERASYAKTLFPARRRS